MICDYCRSAADLFKDGTVTAESPNIGVYVFDGQHVIAHEADGGRTQRFDTVDELRDHLHSLCKGCTCQHREKAS